MTDPNLRNRVHNFNDKVYLVYIRGRIFFIKTEKFFYSYPGLAIAFICTALFVSGYYTSFERHSCKSVYPPTNIIK